MIGLTFGTFQSIITNTPFDPSTITGLTIWLKADIDTYQNSAGTTPAVDDGDPIGNWKDQSGNSNNVIQGTSANKPTLKTPIQNGLPIIRFDGINDLLAKANLGFSGDQPFTMFVVHKPIDTTTPMSLGGFGDSGLALGDMGLYLSIRGAGIPSIEFASNNPAKFISYTSSFQVSTIRKSAGAIDTTVTFKNNGSSQAIQSGSSSGTPSYSATTAFELGRFPNFSGADRYSGDIAEVLLYNSDLSDADILNVEGYLNGRWAAF